MTFEEKSEETQMEEASNSGEEGAVKENQAEEKPDSSTEEKELEESISMITIENGSSFQEEGTQMANEEPNSSMEEGKEPTLDSKSTMEERSNSFREESNFFSHLKETEKKALTDLKAKSEEEMDNKEVSLWGVPLFSTSSNDATSVILLKFLRAREFRVKESLEMIRETLKWREEGGIDSIVDDDELGSEFESACYMDGRDLEGHPVCYNALAVFRDELVYRKAFGSVEGRRNLLRWVARLMEKRIEKLDLRPGGVSSLVQVVDLKDSIGPWRKEVRETMKKGVHILQDNYPEFVARNILVNVPFWYYAFYAALSPFLTQRTKSKFVFARPAQVTETLLKYIPARAVPVCYGGFNRENDTEFTDEDGGVLELFVKSSSTETIEIPATEVGSTVIWEVSVLGWEVNYKEEFVPTDEGSYTVIIQKEKKITGPLEQTIRNSFINSEPGKIVLTIENKTFKKKKVLYRHKAKIC